MRRKKWRGSASDCFPTPQKTDQAARHAPEHGAPDAAQQRLVRASRPGPRQDVIAGEWLAARAGVRLVPGVGARGADRRAAQEPDGERRGRGGLRAAGIWAAADCAAATVR